LPFASLPDSAFPDGGVWPAEFQKPGTFTTKGKIENCDYYPEFVEGDFSGLDKDSPILKDIKHGVPRLRGNDELPGEYSPSEALDYLCQVYKYWIAFLYLDGYRIDTVKHMDKGATRYFCSNIHEFAESIGKRRFYLIGEITGTRQQAFETRNVTGLDAALGIDDV